MRLADVIQIKCAERPPVAICRHDLRLKFLACCMLVNTLASCHCTLTEDAYCSCLLWRRLADVNTGLRASDVMLGDRTITQVLTCSTLHPSRRIGLGSQRCSLARLIVRSRLFRRGKTSRDLERYASKHLNSEYEVQRNKAKGIIERR